MEKKVQLLALSWLSTNVYYPGPDLKNLMDTFVSCRLEFCLYLSELKLEAVTMTSSLFCTSTGIFLQPGDFNNLCNNLSVSVEETKTEPQLLGLQEPKQCGKDKKKS